MSCGEAMAPAIVAASERITQQLLQEGKVLSCGNGLCSALAGMFTQCLTLHYQFERPGLPAVNMSSDASLLNTIAEHHSSEVFSRQVRALGQPGDTLVVFSDGKNAANLVQAVHTAHDREMSVVAFCTDADHNLAALLGSHDIAIVASHTQAHRVAEIHLLGLFAVCELIDQQLFGGT